MSLYRNAVACSSTLLWLINSCLHSTIAKEARLSQFIQTSWDGRKPEAMTDGSKNVNLMMSYRSLSKPHKIKGFVDDITVISKSSKDHSEVLHKISSACSDLDLDFKPPKWVSMTYDGRKVVKDATFQVGLGQTRNISSDLLTPQIFWVMSLVYPARHQSMIQERNSH